MKTAMVEKKSDLIKMENGKKDLPVGISRTKFGSYRMQRTVNNKKYRFGSTQNLEIALSVNAGIDEMVKDLRLALEEPESATAEQVASIVAENSATDMEGIARKFDILFGVIEDQNDLIIRQNNLIRERILDLSTERMSFWQRITGR